jgi:DNA-directed RNA polymerase subunit beta'
VWDALDEVIEGKYVLLNRAPTLHRLGIQAFQPILIEGKAIQLHPLVCKGFNADFDGDQMAVHLPLSKQSQAEAKELMTARRNLLIPADGSPSLHIEQDIVLGVYYMTYEKPGIDASDNKYSSVDEALYAYDQGDIKLQTPITVRAKGETRQTTLGRVLYNEVFPEDFAFQDEPATKKVLLKTMAKIFDQYGEDVTATTADKLKDTGFQFATVSGLSAALADFTDIDGIEDIMAGGEDRATKVAEQYSQGLITDQERYRLTVEAWLEVDKEILEAMNDQFEGSDSPMTLAMQSGARGSIGQLKTSVGSLGVTTDAAGNEIELPIKSNYKSGLSPLEYFIGTRSARMGMISTALKTADSGYLTRKLVDVSQDVFTTDTNPEDPGLLITKAESEERGLEFTTRLAGRVLAEDAKAGDVSAKAGELVRLGKAEELIEAGLEEAMIKSLITVESDRGIPIQSYGADLASGDLVAPNQPVGVIAAQSIGEPGTQLTLDTFHGGGAAGENISQGLSRITELFEARNPKGEAFISEIDGIVTVREHGDDYIIQVAADEDNVYEHEVEDREVIVKAGSKVKKGDTLAEKNGKKKLASKIDGVVEVYDEVIVVVGDKGSVRRYEVPGFKNLTVENGDKVKKAQRLTSGSINPRQLMDLSGVLETQRYIIGEIQRIFSSQGQTINDKHLEVVVRQMFSRVRIDDPGDSTFLIGNTVSRHAVIQENKKLKSEDKELVQYTQLLLGITKVSTWSDSFLSAASFQDTTRVLIAAALSGKQDDLFGLKENVIIGRKIPVGTGINPIIDEDELQTEVDEQ